MIESCIERLKQDLCGTCKERHGCAFHGDKAASRLRSGRRSAAQRRNGFAAFLNAVARAIETRTPSRPTFRDELERRMEPLVAEGEISLSKLARELGYSRQTIYRRLKAEGCSFGEVLDGLRRRLSLRLLRDEGLPVKVVAYRVGFSDPASFSRAFKRWTGTSPGAVRATI